MSELNWLDRDTVRAPYSVLCLSEAEYLRAAEHCNVSRPDAWMDEGRHMAVVHTWEKDGSLTCVVCLHPDAMQADPISVACVLVHESVHIFQRLCESIGETAPSREFEAYSIQRIAEGLMREFLRRKVEQTPEVCVG